MKNKIIMPIVLFMLSTGCSAAGNYTPGTYTGECAENEDGDYAVVELTIGEDNKITAVDFKSYEKGGKLKDADYGKQDGKIANQDYYNKAQAAMEAAEGYRQKFLETGDLGAVEAVSGATLSYDQFTECVDIALSKAESK